MKARQQGRNLSSIQAKSHTFSDNWCKIDCYNDEQVKALFHIECCYSLNDIPLNFEREKCINNFHSFNDRKQY